MLDIAKLPVEHAVAMLSRYAAGRVNPYTVLVGEAMGLTFRMGRQGRLNLETALSKLPTVSTYGNTLEIGFGVEDVTRMMAKSDGGAMQLGLCAALKECFSDDVAIEVLLELARFTRADSQWMPSNLEWRNLLDACAGVLAASNFGMRAEHFMALASGERRLSAFGSLEASPEVVRGCSAPKSLADALVALGRLSFGRMDAVTIRGGPSAGWIAAIAEWFLDLRIIIVDEATGSTLYTNHTDLQNTQVRISFLASETSHLLAQPGTPSATASAADANLAMQRKKRKHDVQAVDITDRTYHLDLEDVTQELLKGDTDYNAHVVSGRLEWKRVLRSAFLSDFDRLMAVSETFGSMIGSAARIFRAVAMADKSIPQMYLRSCTSYCDASFGDGFTVNATAWFPELAKLRGSLEAAAKTSLGDAKKEYEKCISILRSHCGCKTCGNDKNGFKYNEEDFAADRLELNSPSEGSHDTELSTSDAADDWDPDHYCHVVMAETIIVLCRSLSNLSISCEGLLPMRSGLELAYGRQLNTRRSAHLGRQAIRDLGPIAFCMDFDNNFSIVTQGNEEAVEIRLYSVLELFAGRRSASTNFATSAICVNGLTAFFGLLKDTSCETRSDAARIYVIPGRIQFEGKSYTRLNDRQVTPRDDGEAMPFERLSWSEAVLNAGNAYRERLLSVREGAFNLQCLLEFHGLQKTPSVLVGPAAFAAFLGSRRGLVSCRYRSKRPCSKLQSDPGRSVKNYGEILTQVQMGEKLISFMKPPSSSEAITTLASALQSEMGYSTYIVEDECRECCLRTANLSGQQHRTVFCFICLP
jgi:hypothetical protein